MRIMPEIKPKHCPFCGGVPFTNVTVVRGISGDEIRYSIGCDNCCIRRFADICSGVPFEKVKSAMGKAIEAWNRRTPNEL